MPRRRPKKTKRVIHLSEGPLPLRLAGQFADHRLLFSDASQQRHGGLAVVLYENPASRPVIVTRSVSPVGSNELELLAALLALEQGWLHYPGQAFVLFSDNQDAVVRLNRAKDQGLAQDSALATLLAQQNCGAALEHASIRWIPGHSSCRGNALADEHARAAAA